MCCAVKCALKVVLTVLHLLLVIVFGILAVVGALLKFGILGDTLVNLIFSNATIDKTQKAALAEFVNNSLGSVGVILLSVGAVCALVCLFGWIASCCPCGILLKIYAVLLGIILAMQIAFAGYVFGSPDYLPDQVLGLMGEALKSYSEDSKEKPAYAIWSLVMTSNKDICCGLGGYKDFKETNELPIPCCTKKDQESPSSCDVATAEKANVAGCTNKIKTFVKTTKAKILPIPIALIFGLLVLLVVVVLAAFC